MKQCNECPFKKDSAPGYLGEASYNPELFLQSMTNQPIPCHKAVKDWNDDQEINEKAWSKPCIGSLKFLRNTATLPKDNQYVELRNSVEKDSGCFGTRQDFINHHS